MADDERSAEVGSWLEVEPLDDVTRRRLVSAALRETADAPAPARPWRTWRWLAAAAAVVIIAVGTLAVVTSGGGDDTRAASRGDRSALAPKNFGQALTVAPDVGDFGNLDDATNLARLRAALGNPSAEAVEPQAAAGAASDSARSTPLPSLPGCSRGTVGTVIASGSGTIAGHAVTVVLLEGPDGTRSIQALFQDSCTGRDLGSP